MIKLKDILKESITWENRKFGERLPTLADYKKLKEGELNEDEAGDVLNDYIYYQLANTIKDTQKKWGKVQDCGDKNPKKAQVIIKMVVALDKKIKQISR